MAMNLNPQPLAEEVERLKTRRKLDEFFEAFRIRIEALEENQDSLRQKVFQMQQSAYESGPVYTKILEAMLAAVGREDLLELAKTIQNHEAQGRS